jgi:Domain of unknown function (DUF6438)
MRCRRSANAVLLACLATSCVSPRAQSQPADTASSDAIDALQSISLERGSCRGACPAYIVTLQHDGVVRFVGIRSVRPIGTDSSRVAPSSVASLQKAFAVRQFARVPSTIEYGTPSCGSYVADLPTHVLTVRSDAGAHRVRYDEGCRDHPMLLDTLARIVDSVSGAARWTVAARR